MKIAIGSDHRGYLLKEQIEQTLTDGGHEIRDVGAHSEKSVDYPDLARVVSDLVGQGEYERGILVCGSGIGMSIAANKRRGVRAALCTSLALAELSRRHNDSNVLCLGSQNQSAVDALQMVDVWLKTEFEGGRHSARLEKIRKMEE